MIKLETLIKNGYKLEKNLDQIYDSAILGVIDGPEPCLVYDYSSLITVLVERGNDIEVAEQRLEQLVAEYSECKSIAFVHTVAALTD